MSTRLLNLIALMKGIGMHCPAAVGVEPAGTGNWYWGQDLTNAVAAADSQDSSQIVIPTGYCENGEWVLQFDTSNAVIYVMTDQYGSSQPLQPISGLYVDLPTDIEVTFGNTGPYPMLSWYFLWGWQQFGEPKMT